jgi:hypothetical protein
MGHRNWQEHGSGLILYHLYPVREGVEQGILERWDLGQPMEMEIYLQQIEKKHYGK